MCSGSQCHSLVSSRVWLSGAGVLVLLAVWLVYVYVRREFESRSRHKVCPCCLDAWRCCGAIVRHSNFDQLQGEVASAGCRHSGQRDDAGNVRAISSGVVRLVQFRIS